MAKLPTLRRWTGLIPIGFEELIKLLNTFMQDVTNALNGQLSLVDNVKAEIKTINRLAPIEDVTLPTNLQPVNAVILGRIVGPSPASPPVLQWHQAQNSVIIDSVSNLTTGEAYAVTFILL